MTELDDLRHALNERATDLADHGLSARTGAVRHRVAVVRRRRRSAVAGSAAAVLAVVAGIALLPDASKTPPEVSTTIVGIAPPEQMTSLGYTYTFDRGIEGKGDVAIVDLPASNRPRLVTWATEGADDTVSVTDRARGETVTYASPDFSDFLVFREGEAGRVRVETADGSRAGLAVYSIDLDSPPPGVSRDGITFRDEVAGSRLLAAEIGEPGVTDLTIDTTAETGSTDTTFFCAEAPQGAFLRVERAGVNYIGEEECDGAAPVDVSIGGFFESQPGERWKVRVYLTDGADGPPIVDSSARIGVAAYAAPPPSGTGALERAASELVEYRGHRYVRDQVIDVPSGNGNQRIEVGNGDMPTLIYGFAKARSTETRFRFPRGSISSLGPFGSVAGTSLGLARGPGATVLVRRTSTGAVERSAQAAIITYVRAE